ncbi:MAG: putative sulfate exporter family transporter [Myxococcota bacterium]
MTAGGAKKALFLALALVALTPWVTAPLALVAGIVFSLAWGNPFAAQTKQWQTWLLQASVVGLGAGMNLGVVARVGARGVGVTLVGLTVTILLALALARAMKTERTTSLLIGVGTAICGGSAIAAVAPAIGAKSHQASVSLAVVFLLNAAALLVFPAVGHQVHLGPEQFGLWSALAIHDTSSVVGASTLFGPVALAVGTTVKLARALWIIPLTLLLARVWKHEATQAGGKPKRPWFILGFVGVAALVTYVPFLEAPGKWVAEGARHVLVLTLFLVGAGVSRDALKQVGARPLVLGVLLWVLVASATLAAILLGWLEVPRLS